MALIEFRGVRKAFGDKRIYQHLDLDVEAGETHTIIGGSGTGKSVLLKLLIGLLRPDSGEIRFDGVDVVGLSDRMLLPIRRRVGMLFQGGALFDSMSVGDNVAYGVREHEELPEKRVRVRVAEALEAVGMPGIETMLPADLSGGMRKRVALARVIAMRPEVVLYDEPTTGLDPINTNRINQLINTLQERMHITSVVVTHDMGSAFAISDRITMVGEGRTVYSGTPEAVRALKAGPVYEFVRGLSDEVPVEPSRSGGGAGGSMTLQG